MDHFTTYPFANEIQQYGRQWEDTINDLDDEWDNVPTFDPLHRPNAHFVFHQPDPSAMQRYLQDREGPWFNFGAPAIPHFESLATQPLPTIVAYGHDTHQHLTSPSNSGTPSEDTHSGWNDEQSTPWSSPGPSAGEYSPLSAYAALAHHGHGGGVAQFDSAHGVSMHDVQGYPDDLPDQTRLDDEVFVHYNPVAEEGYQPRTMEIDQQTYGDEMATAPYNAAESRPQSPNVHRRRVSAAQAATSPTATARVAKRPYRRRRASSSSSRSNPRLNGVVETPLSNRSFPCLFVKYGCESTFGTKNEWKRHVFTQHMRTGLWRCDQCDTSEKNKHNDFNRKDLFVQHVRRMHPLAVSKANNAKPTGPRSHKKDPEDRHLSDIADRCYKRTRSLPDECGCHFCEARFSGSTAWEERMEHVGGHMETTKKENNEAADPQTWRDDKALEEYLKREHIIELKGKRYVLAEAQK